MPGGGPGWGPDLERGALPDPEMRLSGRSFDLFRFKPPSLCVESVEKWVELEKGWSEMDLTGNPWRKRNKILMCEK